MAVSRRSWVEEANDPACEFPIENLPYGVFRQGERKRIGVAIGGRILDLQGCAREGLLSGLPTEIVAACHAEVLNPLMALGAAAWHALRERMTELLDADEAHESTRRRAGPLLVAMGEAVMELPAEIGDYTDFYASIHHATRVGRLFRPENPLLPNYRHVPIGYHGRASSIVVSGQEIRRPCGQMKRSDESTPVFAPTQALDYELEVGVFVGPGNAQGHSIPIDEAEEHVFGLCLLNDWSARDVQAWEYQPLGPFLAKNFATTISPWIVPMEALAAYRVPGPERAADDPAPLGYLQSPSAERDGIDVTLRVYLESRKMREEGAAPVLLSTGNLRALYWSLAQLVTHHASNGCNLRPGDLLATGTISGPERGSEGCLLEMMRTHGPLALPSGERRTFLEDGDRVIFDAQAHSPGMPRIGFGACTGLIAPSEFAG